MDRNDLNHAHFELADLGPKPWKPGNGLSAEDVIQRAGPMALCRARGVSFEDIAARFNMPVQRVAAILLRFSHGLAQDVAQAGFTSDLTTLDSEARAEDEARAAD